MNKSTKIYIAGYHGVTDSAIPRALNKQGVLKFIFLNFILQYYYETKRCTN